MVMPGLPFEKTFSASRELLTLPFRRTFNARDKLSILAEVDASRGTPGGVGAVMSVIVGAKTLDQIAL